MNEVDPRAWLTQTLERIAHGWPISNIDQFMPVELQILNDLGWPAPWIADGEDRIILNPRGSDIRIGRSN
jgi:hypothetical protein